MARYMEVGAFVVGAIGVPYLIGGNSLVNIGKIIIHSVWGGKIIMHAVRVGLPVSRNAYQDDRMTRISTVAHAIFFYGITLAAYLVISPQYSLLRCAAVCIVSRCIDTWAENSKRRPNAMGLVPETISEIRFYSMISESARTLLISSLVSTITLKFFI